MYYYVYYIQKKKEDKDGKKGDRQVLKLQGWILSRIKH